MAQMIPPVVGESCRSGGEREVFLRLRDDPDTGDWIVLHSLGLATHQKRVEGEVDFVAIIPRGGVLCVEVKGCAATNLRRAEGLWYYGPDDPGSSRSPFQQVSEAMHSLRRQLVAQKSEYAAVQFSSCVIFPYAVFREHSVEWHDWQVIDSRSFRSAPLGKLLRKVLEDSRTHLRSVYNSPQLAADCPTRDQCHAIRDALRRNFEIPADPGARAGALRAELLRYTGEQLLALDAMTENPRALFVGPAGTGKTFLAIEAARRAHAAGRKVLFVCFNRLLGAWLDEVTVDLRPNVCVRTLHRHMLAVSGADPNQGGTSSEFWQTQLPELACNRLLDARDTDECFVDELVVDEAQDILRGAYLDFLDLSLRGGLAAGQWRIFGDFENAAIYAAANVGLEDFRSRRSGGAPIFSLRVNCRNTPLIAEYVRLLGGLNPPYQRVLRPNDGVSPELLFYGRADEQHTRLSGALTSLRAAGFSGPDIVVLSPLAEGACANLLAQTKPWAQRLTPLGTSSRTRVRYGSIHAFKGLEAAAIVVTDIETIGTPGAKALFYVALTRALQRLVILATERVRSEILNLLKTLRADKLDCDRGTQ